MIAAVLVILPIPCPFQSFIGLPCPGCNMTTACYYFLQGKFALAGWFNPAFYLLLIFGLLCLLGLWQDRTFLNTRLFRGLLWIVLILWLFIWVVRMVMIFPDAPMIYVEENTLAKAVSLLQRLFRN